MMDRRMWPAAVLLALAAVAIVWGIAPIAPSADLKAVWLAGQFWDMGRLDEIYPVADGLFTMRPPPGWAEWLGTEAISTEQIYPFLYPPIWAVLAGTLTGPDFAVFANLALWANAAFLMATVLLAIRVVGSALSPLVHALLVLAIFVATPLAIGALAQGQPQFFVTFLLVLAVERARAGAGVAAGLALALAASIKLYPAIYLVIWLATGQRRAVWSFVLAGAGLAGLSVLLAGWPLHQAFLHTISQIGRTLLSTGASMSFDALFGQLALAGHGVRVDGVVLDDGSGKLGGWTVFARPPLWSYFVNMALIGVLAGLAFAARRARPEALYRGVWPLALTLSVLFAPTGWLYYLLAGAVFAPTLIAALGVRRGGLLFMLGLVLLATGPTDLARHLIRGVVSPGPFFYVAGALVWALGFGLVAARGRVEEDRTLHRAEASL